MINNNKHGLGRGLDALFGVFNEDDSYKNITSHKEKLEAKNTTGVTEVDIEKIKPNPNAHLKYHKKAKKVCNINNSKL